MTAPDVMPAAFAIPAAALGWFALLWPTIITRIPLSWRERFTPHRWVRVPLSEGYRRTCVRHQRCRPRYYNAHGVRLCDGWNAGEGVSCDLYHGHPFPHFNIRGNWTWR